MANQDVIFSCIFLAVIFLISWLIWAITSFSDLTGIDAGKLFWMLLCLSAIAFTLSFLWSYFMEWHRLPLPIFPEGEAFRGTNLIRGHAVSGRRVKAYETYWIAGLYFTFAFVPWPREKFRVYILVSPSYCRRDDSLHPTHRLFDASVGCHFICIREGSFPETLEGARSIALAWAQGTARYIKTGETFG